MMMLNFNGYFKRPFPECNEFLIASFKIMLMFASVLGHFPTSVRSNIFAKYAAGKHEDAVCQFWW